MTSATRAKTTAMEEAAVEPIWIELPAPVADRFAGGATVTPEGKTPVPAAEAGGGAALAEIDAEADDASDASEAAVEESADADEDAADGAFALVVVAGGTITAGVVDAGVVGAGAAGPIVPAGDGTSFTTSGRACDATR